MHNTKLKPKEAAQYLRLSASLLAKFRCHGGGPQYAKAGPRLVLYEVQDLDAWLKARVCSNTSHYAKLGDCS